MSIERYGNKVDERKAVQSILAAMYPGVMSTKGLSDDEIQEGKVRAEKIKKEIQENNMVYCFFCLIVV